LNTGSCNQRALEGKISDNWTGTCKIVIKMASIDTANAKRNAHLKNEDFFNVEMDPESVFTIEKAEWQGDRLAGNLGSEVTGTHSRNDDQRESCPFG
jgi:polyisoprenoid-binding protein YceI